VYSAAISPDGSVLGLAAADTTSCVYLAARKGVLDAAVTTSAGSECVATLFDTTLDAAGEGWPIRTEISGSVVSVFWEPLQGAVFHRLVCNQAGVTVNSSAEGSETAEVEITLPARGQWLCQVEAHPRSGAVLSTLVPVNYR
jgi:hypothetical protein